MEELSENEVASLPYTMYQGKFQWIKSLDAKNEESLMEVYSRFVHNPLNLEATKLPSVGDRLSGLFCRWRSPCSLTGVRDGESAVSHIDRTHASPHMPHGSETVPRLTRARNHSVTLPHVRGWLVGVSPTEPRFPQT